MVVLIALMAMVMLPHQQVQSNVVQIKEAMDEAVSAETFARFYERQLREAAAFIVTGQPEHQRLYEQSKEQARIGIADWLAAENRHTGDSPAEHATELKMLHATLAGNADVAKAADWSIALAGSGQRAQAMENLQKAIAGDAGETVSNNVDDQLPDEEAQLNKYLDNLSGAVKSMVVMRLLNLGPNVESMKTHFANTIYAERMETSLYKASRSLIQINIETHYAVGYADYLASKLGIRSGQASNTAPASHTSGS